jgi:hypothetical protein
VDVLFDLAERIRHAKLKREGHQARSVQAPVRADEDRSGILEVFGAPEAMTAIAPM